MRSLYRPIIFLIAVLVTVQVSPAQRTVRMNLERIVSDGAMIFRGTVISVTTGADERTKLLTTTVTFSVKENFYGADQPSVTVSLLGGSTKKKRVALAEMPVFTVGEEMIVSFFAPSAYGLTSPVGMSQGKFLITTDPVTSQRTIRATGNNPQLFKGLKNVSALAKRDWAERTVRSVTVEDFSATIRSLVTMVKK